MIEKPSLNDEYLAHFGRKGMKWGVRHKRSDEEKRKTFFDTTGGKVAVGVATVAGAVAVSYLLSKRGRTKVADAALTEFVVNRQRKAQIAANPFGKLAQQFRNTKAADVPSPDHMIADARMAAVRQRVANAGSQRLTDKAWRDQARLSSMAREMDQTTNGLLNGTQSQLDQAARARLGSLR